MSLIAATYLGYKQEITVILRFCILFKVLMSGFDQSLHKSLLIFLITALNIFYTSLMKKNLRDSSTQSFPLCVD